MTSRRIAIIMSDTGGGHRAAAEAIVQALEREFPQRYNVTLFDGFKQAAVLPFNRVPSWYLPFTTYFESLWHFLFLSTNNRFTAVASQFLFDALIARGIRKFLRDYSPDLVISTHPIFNAFARRSLRAVGSRAPFVTVVTDLFDAHILWFDPGVDFCTVPTEGAREKGLRFGMPAEKMRVVGEPVSLKFIDGVSGQLEARAKLGLAPNLPTLLLVGGGEGMGKLYDIARAIDQATLGVPAQLVVIAGRNEHLVRRLQSAPWQIPVRVEGFVRNMPDWMYAADVIITKAGPGTISEAMACGLPILLSGFLPGQETGNVTFVEQNGIGILQKEPAAIARTLGEWLAPGNDTLARLAMRSHKLSRPRAALEIAKLVDQMLNAEHVA